MRIVTDDDEKITYHKYMANIKGGRNITNTILKKGMFEKLDDGYKNNYDDPTSKDTTDNFSSTALIHLGIEKISIDDKDINKNHKYYHLYEKINKLKINYVSDVVKQLMYYNHTDTATIIIILVQVDSTDYIIKLENKTSTRRPITYIVFVERKVFGTSAEKGTSEKENTNFNGDIYLNNGNVITYSYKCLEIFTNHYVITGKLEPFDNFGEIIHSAMNNQNETIADYNRAALLGRVSYSHNCYDMYTNSETWGVKGIDTFIAYLMCIERYDIPTIIIVFRSDNKKDYVLIFKHDQSIKEPIMFIVFVNTKQYSSIEITPTYTQSKYKPAGNISIENFKKTFKVHDNDGSGNCLFYAISAGLLYNMIQRRNKTEKKVTDLSLTLGIELASISNGNDNKTAARRKEVLSYLIADNKDSYEFITTVKGNIGYDKLREQVCNFYQSKEFETVPYFQNIEFESVVNDEYIGKLCTDTTFAESVDIYTLSFLHKVKILLYSRYAQEQEFTMLLIGDELNETRDTIHIEQNGQHFLFLEPKPLTKGGSIIKLRKTKQNKKRLNKRKTKRQIIRV